MSKLNIRKGQTMKTMRFKFSAATLAWSPARPQAPLGLNLKRGITTQEVTEIPDAEPRSEVMRLMSASANLTWLGKRPDGTPKIMGDGRYSLRFDELGIGRMIFA